MFANLVQLVSGRLPPELDPLPFVQEVHVSQREPRSPKLERQILVCWSLIAVKHVAVIWVCNHYPVPFHQLWVNGPTWMLGALATGVYFWSVRRG